MRTVVCGVATVLLALWVTVAGIAQVDPLAETRREKQGLVGAVGAVLVEQASHFQGSQGVVEGPRIRTESLTFGTDGLLQGWVHYDPAGRPTSTTEYTYSNGVLVREETYGPTGGLIERILYTENGPGKTTAVVQSRTGTLRKTIIYERNAEGKLLTLTETDAAGALTSKLVYTYTPGELRVDTYDKDGKIVSWSVEKYDSRGHLIGVSLYTQGADQPFFTATFTVDERGNTTQAETSGQGFFGFFSLSPGGAAGKTSYEYSFDKTGNWTKKVESTWLAAATPPAWLPRLVTYRTILYFQ